MKHIKRKFLYHDYLQKNIQIKNAKEINIQEIDQKFLKEKSKEHFAIITTDIGEKVLAFIYNDNGKQCLIPVPDFTLVNYNFAYNLNLQRKELRKKLVQNLADLNVQNELSSNFAYDYHGTASSCIICLFTSIECFLNSIIPDNFEYKIANDKKTEIYNKSQIQYSISFNEKLTKVIPIALGKNFFAKETTITTRIYNLRDLRNDIIHIKSDNGAKNHIEILKRLLNFKYDETFDAVFKLFNFYAENYIQECSCSESY